MAQARQRAGFHTGHVITEGAFFAVMQGIRGVEWGLRSYVDVTTGLTLVLLGVVIASTARTPRPVGYLMGLAGLAYIVQSYGYGTGCTAISDRFVLNSTNSVGSN